MSKQAVPRQPAATTRQRPGKELRALHNGVVAGRRGGFGLVVGVAWQNGAAELSAAGGHLVVSDLSDVQLAGPGPLADGWHQTYRPAGAAGEGMRETLCTLSNGYLATRGAPSWATADGTHYPGTYLAGVYIRLGTSIAGRRVEHESIVNAPNWLPLSFSAGGGPWLGEPGIRSARTWPASGCTPLPHRRHRVVSRAYRVLGKGMHAAACPATASP